MKLSFVVTLLVAGLFAVGSASVILHGVAVGSVDSHANPRIADGDPQPPLPRRPLPLPPLAIFVADGDPQPPIPHVSLNQTV